MRLTFPRASLRAALIAFSIVFSYLPSADVLAIANETDQPPPLIFSIHPYISAERLIRSYKPLTDYLSQTTGRQIKIKIASDYSSQIRLIGEDKVDIAYLGPASYVDMVKRYGKKPMLARLSINGTPLFHGKIIVRDESAITSLSALAGKRFAFGDPRSTMSHLVPRYMLLDAGVTKQAQARFDFLGSHDNVALAVLSGDYDAGAVNESLFDIYKSRGLKVLQTTPALSEHLIVTSSRLPAALFEKLQRSLFALKDKSDGTIIMTKIKNGLSAMVSVSDSDYDNLRLILDALAQEGY